MKRTKPKTFAAKYIGKAVLAAKTLKSNLTDALGTVLLDEAQGKVKRAKAEVLPVNITGAIVVVMNRLINL